MTSETSDLHPFSQPTRQSPAALVFILGGVVKNLFRQFWYAIPILFFGKKGSVSGWTIFFILLAIFSAIMSLLNYFKLFFYIKDGELVLEKGVIRKSKINVPLDRVQTVNFRQNILHQIFNVVAIDIDTAGSAGKEFSLHALSKPQAELLRELVGRKQSAVGPKGINSGPQRDKQWAVDEEQIEVAKEELLFSLKPMDLFKIGLSQNHLRTAGIVAAFVLSFADDVEEAFGFKWEKKMEWWLGTTSADEIIWTVLAAVPFFLVVSFVITLFRTVLQYFNLRFIRNERGFKIVSGLFTRQEVSAVLTKVQYVLWSSSPLMRWLKMWKVRMPQAASVVVKGKLMVGLPGCYGPQLDTVRAAYFPGEKQQAWEMHGVSGWLALLRFLKIGVIPTALLVFFTFDGMQSWAWLWLLWLPLSAWLSVQYQRNWQWEISEEGFRAAWGAMNRTHVLLQWHKVQSVSIRRGFFSERSKYARLTLYTAAGAVQVPFIPFKKAQAVQDFVLYKVETDEREWM